MMHENEESLGTENRERGREGKREVERARVNVSSRASCTCLDS